jgi:serine/threonine protein kinase/predicted negative regulator of RcsB-dependent stress response
MPFKPGEQVGPYRIMEKLGRGGMATVFKAYHANLDRYVAIKVLHPAFMEDPNFIARFQREARVVAKLEHPNIIPVYDFAEHEGKTYLVMKYVEGETLKARLLRKPLSPEEGIRVIETVGEALSFAHKQDILHRDVKPSNVMIGDDGQIYLTDFGLARIASAGESTLSSDMMIGTPQYISPEQALGTRELDAGTDIYSFGVLIYEIVVGQVPFSSDTPFSIIHDHIYTPLPLPRAVNPNVPEVIERLLLKALSKEREDRFETIEQMVKAFKMSIRGEELPEQWVDPDTYVGPAVVLAEAQTQPPVPVPDEFTTPPPEPVKKGKRKRWWLAIPITLGLCLCAFVAIAIINQDQAVPTVGPFGPKDRVGEKNPPPFKPDEKDIPALEEALRQAQAHVDENLEDPRAYLDLANAFLDLGRMDEAMRALEKGEEFAGDKLEYFELAGDMLASRDLWLPALEQYIKGFPMDGGRVPPEYLEKLRQTLYYASIDPDVEDLLFNVNPRELSTQLAQVIVPTARARFMLHHRDPEKALDTVDNVLENHPDVPETRLVKAEILIKLGRADEAEVILNELVGEQISSWVRVEARRLLAEIK